MTVTKLIETLTLFVNIIMLHCLQILFEYFLIANITVIEYLYLAF